MNWTRVLIAVIAAVVLAAGGFFAYQQFVAQPDETSEASTAVAAPVIDTALVSAEGQIVPLRDARLAFQGGGPVVEIFVESGDTVAAGDPLLSLDTADQEVAVAQAQSALETARALKTTAEAGLQATQTGARAAEIGVKAAEVELALVTADPRSEEIALQESAVALAQAGIGQASANQSVVLEGPRSSTIQSAEARLRAAEAALLPVRDALDVLRREDSPDADALDRAQRNYNAAVANVNAAQAAVDEARAGATSGQRQAAFGGVAAAQAQRSAAEAQLDLVLAGSRAEQIAVAEAGVEQARTAAQEAALAVSEAEAAVTQAEAGIAQAEAALKSAQDALALRTLTAPFDGVAADVMVEIGEVVTGGVPAAMLADFGGWLVKTTDLTELDVVDLNIGDTVEIQIDAIPGRTITGTVTDISETAQVVRGDVTYEVTIALDDPGDLPLRWGMTVFVDVDVE